MVAYICKEEMQRKTVFDYIQVEITSRCFSRCIMCPHTLFSKRWVSKDMPFGLYKQISSYFSLAHSIHLQGWGEPLVHPDFLTMLDIARREAKEVSFTTNGLFLDRLIAREIIEMGISFVSFSIAGVTRETQKHLRESDDLDLIFNNISYLRELKRETGRKQPRIHISYMITKKNFQELPRLVDKAFELGVSEIVSNNMDYLPSVKLQGLPLFLRSEEEKNIYSEFMEEASKRARKRGMKLKIQPLDLEEVLVCEANPLKNIFITVSGGICPCTYLGIPVKGGIIRHFQGRNKELRIKDFGTLEKEDLLTIWNKPEYKHFREYFEQRIKADRMASTPVELARAMQDNPLPEECQTCYKAYGI